MSEEKKCCKHCKAEKCQLSNEDLENVTGGTGSQTTNYICTKNDVCESRATVNGIANVCTCGERPTLLCCVDLKDNCKCYYWDQINHRCKDEEPGD